MKKRLQKIVKIVLAVCLGIGISSADVFTGKDRNVEAATSNTISTSYDAVNYPFTVTVNSTVGTLNNANLVSATAYVNDNPNIAFDVNNFAAADYQRVPLSVSGKKITSTLYSKNYVFYIIIIAKDSNGVEYFCGFVPKWDGTKWNGGGGYQQVENPAGSKNILVNISASYFQPNVISLNDIIIEGLSTTGYPYTGTKIEPKATAIKLKKDSIFNSSGADLTIPSLYYTYSYVNNINVGTGSMSIQFKTPYRGTVSRVFDIKARSFATSEISVTYATSDYIYTGNQILPNINVIAGGKRLVLGTDYDVKFAVGNTSTDVGSGYKAAIQLKGNYTGMHLVTNSYNIVDGTSEPFMNSYLGSAANPYTSATEANYKNILAGKAAYDRLNTKQQELPKLANADYPRLYKEALAFQYKETYQDLWKLKEVNYKDLTNISKALLDYTNADIVTQGKLNTEKKMLDEFIAVGGFLTSNQSVLNNGKVDFTTKANIEKARAEFNALSTEQKALVSDEVKAKLGYMETAQKFIEDNQALLAKNKADLTKDDIDDIKALLKKYDEQPSAIKAVYADSIQNKIKELQSFVDESAFVDTYVSDTAKSIYKDVTPENYEQILGGEEIWGKFDTTQKSAINTVLTDNGGKTYPDLLSKAKALKGKKDNFIQNYTSDNEGALYKAATAENFEQILTGEGTWNSYSDDEKKAVNDALKKNGGVSYDAMIATAKEIKDKKETFIKDFVSDDKGIHYKTTTPENYKQILAGKEEWNSYTKEQKDAINDALTNNGGKTYPELLKDAQALEINTNTFVKNYVSDKNEIKYKTAIPENYEQILSGKDDWDSYTKDQQKAINDILTANGGETYPDLLKKASSLQTKRDSFIQAYVSDDENHKYKAATAENFEQLLSGEADWNTYTDEQKKVVNDALIKNGGESYTTMLETAKGIKEKKEAFIKDYVSDAEGNTFKTITPENYKQILSGKNDWDSYTKEQKDAINNELVKDGSKTYPELIEEAQALEENTNGFVHDYTSNEDGEIYKETTPENYEQILSGEADWNNYTEDQKQAINDILTTNSGKTYPELLEKAQALKASTDDFIDKYVSDVIKVIYKTATAQNYAQILSGEAAWEEMSEEQKAAVNKALTEQGGKTYEELLKMAHTIETNTNSFIKKYVSDDNGNIYKAATVNNYLQILSGEAEWNSLSQIDQDAINAILIKNGGKTYEELLKVAKKLKNDINTGDTTAMLPYMMTLLLSGAAIILLKKRNKTVME